ncbi:NAD(P)-dependent oxidoreductase [Amylibacter sp.]|nr:NAD(P)-dependent oxidoreductase [Amylibacter sp.]MDC1532080.1 NAD(P)-dependent oxidoreductase [Amylibacter sp.]
MKKILITGGSGFIGTNLINYMMDSYEIMNLDIKEPKIAVHRKYWAELDIRDIKEFSIFINTFKPDYIIHLAARTDLNGKLLSNYDSNTIGTQNLLNIIGNYKNLEKVIFASSKFIAPNGYKVENQYDMCPHTTYGESKAEMERLIWNKPPKCDWLIIRPTSIWGPYFAEPYKFFFDYILKGFYFQIGNQKCFKTYGFIGNTVYQIQQLLVADTNFMSNKIYYLGDDPPYEINEWAKEIAVEINQKIPKVPSILVKLISYFGDFIRLFGINFPMNSFRYHNMTQDGINELSEINKLAPSLPFTRLAGTKLTLRWMTKTKIFDAADVSRTQEK